METRALVLAGGGLTGIAWELGMLAGLAGAGVPLLEADRVIGTSAGSVVGAQVTSGCPLDDLIARQLDPAAGATEISVDFDRRAFRDRLAQVVEGARCATEARARIGRLALAAETVPEVRRRQVIASRLPVHRWPERDLLVTAVDAASGTFATFDRNSGVELIDAVAASCAVPGVWPPVTIAGRRFVDGGMRSGTNADLAQGCGRVVVLVPYAPEGVVQARIDTELRRIGGGEGFVVTADRASLAAIGEHPLDPARRPAAARAGLAQAEGVADALRTFW